MPRTLKRGLGVSAHKSDLKWKHEQMDRQNACEKAESDRSD